MLIYQNTLKYNDYLLLRESVGWNTNFSDSQMTHAIDSSAFIVSVYDHQKIVGMGRLIGDGLYYYLIDVIVHPSYQSRGIGKSIVERIVTWIKQNLKDNERVSLILVSAKGKEKFYEKLGFHSIPDDVSGYGMQRFIFHSEERRR